MGVTDDTAAKRRRIPTPEEEAKAGLYLDADGSLYLPSEGFWACGLAGAKGHKMGKYTAPAVFSSYVSCCEPRTPLVDPDTEEPLLVDYQIDTRRAIVQRQGILRSRPRFERWGAIVKFEFDPTRIADKVIIDFLKIGGSLSGVGDFRPAKKGGFGKFMPVKAWLP